MKHTRTYYTVRTAVRTLFWGGLALGALLVVGEAMDDDTPVCQINIYPGRWEAKGAPVNVSECVAPHYWMVLSQDGTWYEQR
jgi:hypothetical protein